MKSQIWTLILQSFQNNNFVDIAFRTVSGKSARNTWFKTQKHINSGKTRENQKRRILNIAITTNTKNVNKYRTYYLKRIVGFYRRSTVWCNGWTFFQNPDTKFDEEESLYGTFTDVGSINGRRATKEERGRYHTIVMKTWPRASIFLHTKTKISFRRWGISLTSTFEKSRTISHVKKLDN